jgi:hypothetical protein
MDADDLPGIMEPPGADDRHIEVRLGLPPEVACLVTAQPSSAPGEGQGR